VIDRIRHRPGEHRYEKDVNQIVADDRAGIYIGNEVGKHAKHGDFYFVFETLKHLVAYRCLAKNSDEHLQVNCPLGELSLYVAAQAHVGEEFASGSYDLRLSLRKVSFLVYLVYDYDGPLPDTECA